MMDTVIKKLVEILNKNKIYKERTKGEYSHNDVCMGLKKYRRLRYLLSQILINLVKI